jgi:hypothetical protein
MYVCMHACMSSDQINDVVKGVACSMYGRKVKHIEGFGGTA